MPHLLAVYALAFIPLFSFCDREIGDGRNGLVRRSVAVAMAVILGGALGWSVFGPSFLAVGALWAACRSIGFADGELDPSTTKAAIGCALRYLLWLPMSLQAFWRGDNPLLMAGPLLAAIVVIMLMRLNFGAMTLAARANGLPLKGDFNATIERTSGALFGAALVAYAFLAHH